MSITFSIQGEHHCGDYDCADCNARQLNLANRNALDLLVFLGIEPDYCGGIRGRELAQRVENALADPHATDPEVPTTESRGGRVISCGRPAGYLRERATWLLDIARLAGDLGRVSWG